MSVEGVKQIQEVHLTEVEPASGAGRALVDRNLDLIRDVKVRVMVSAGSCEITVKELFELKEHSVLALDKDTSEPVDLLLDGKIVARGTLVAVGDNFGIQILEVLHR